MFQCRNRAFDHRLIAVALGLVLTHAVAAHAQPVLPSNFQETTAFSGLELPTAVKFARDGRVFVAEKSGLVKVFDNLTDTSPTVFADLRTQVHNFWDRGLLGLELHPSFPDVPYVYVLYTLDRLPRTLWTGAGDPPIPQWGAAGSTYDGCPDPPGATGNGCAVTGRLSRLTAVGNSSGPEQMLIEDWCQQFPSHTIGALAFGSDGALYVSAGDGASFNYPDYGQTAGNICGDPPVPVGGSQTGVNSQGGALRSQSLRRPNGPAALNGTILRIDAETGAALPDNPLAHSSDLRARRVVAYGLRNPFRFAMRPGTSEIWIGDVGWGAWEEVDRVPNPTGGVLNFGWPCYEGNGRQGGYDGLNNTQCENLYNGILAPGIDPIAAGTLTAPFYTYNHNADVVSGDVCPPNTAASVSSSIAGLAFYRGGPYPGSYNGALFFADYSRDCIWAFMPGSGGLPNASNRIMFVGRAANPVALEIGPNGDLFYVDIDNGRIRRVSYLGTNNAPVAALSASQTSGPAPLTVNFSAAGSSDLDNDPLTYAWDLDNDGQFDDATGVTASRTFGSNGVYMVHVRVTDDANASDTDSVTISVGSAQPTATINTPSASLTWKVGDTISFSGSATDPQDGPLTGNSLTWTLVINHCPNNDCHQHVVQSWNGASGSFVAPDHEYPSSLELRFRAVDSGGLSDTKTVTLNPQTVSLTVAASTPGLTLGLNAESAAAPFTRTVIIGSSNSISAPSPQGLSGSTYTFQSWSDGGAASHNVTAPATATTYTATFTSSPGGGALPSGWLSTDIGATGTPGSASYSSGTFTVRGAGSDIWYEADAFHYAYQTLNGDGEIRARVVSLTNTNAWAKTGVMIRQSLTPSSAFAMVAITPLNGAALQWRPNNGDSALSTPGPAVAAPHWVRLVRAGNSFTGFLSPDGTTWTQFASATIVMPATVYMGFPITSHVYGELGTAVIDQGGSGNSPPVAALTADKTSGAAPLTVQFSAAGSTDPNSDPLTYAWDLDNDGQFDDGTAATATRTFTTNGTYTVRVRVTDDDNASDTESIEIRVGNTAPTATITTPAASLTWKVGDLIAFSGSATDPEDGGLSGTALSWTVILNNCTTTPCQPQTFHTATGTNGSFTAPNAGHPSTIEVRLTATDSGGLTNTRSVVLQPQTVSLTLASSPAGLTLSFNGTTATAPIARTVIVGSSNTIAAPTPQTVGSVTYTFQSWSDAGAATHAVTAPAANTTYTATYTGSGGTGPLPSPWLNTDVGSPAAAGSATFNSGAFTVRGSGTDIWYAADGFHFVYQPFNGDVEIRARVASLTSDTHPWAKAGVMVRQALTAGSQHATMAITPGNGVTFQRRTVANADSLSTAGALVTAPYWVRLVRSGNTFTGYSSPDGTNWTLVGSTTIAMSASVYVGLPITSHNDGVLATTIIEQVTVATPAPPPPPPSSGAFTPADIGNPGVAGSTSFANSVYTVQGSGWDIWNTSDAFHFAYQSVSGDASIVARVDSLQNTNPWAKVGVMIRDGLGAGARHVFMAITPSNGTAFQRRTSAGGSSLHTAGPAVTAPYWVRVVRSGNTFTASVSTNGSTWTTVGSVSITMPTNTLAGLAVTSHDDALVTTAVFSQVTVVP